MPIMPILNQATKMRLNKHIPNDAISPIAMKALLLPKPRATCEITSISDIASNSPKQYHRWSMLVKVASIAVAITHRIKLDNKVR